MKKTQLQIVRERLERYGSVDNFWAIQHYILRLGARIDELRIEGMKIEGAFGKALGKKRPNWKNYYYLLK